jgi:hypothetical protein
MYLRKRKTVLSFTVLVPLVLCIPLILIGISFLIDIAIPYKRKMSLLLVIYG